MKNVVRATVIALLVAAGLVVLPGTPVAHAASSNNVALVPDENGQAGNGGSLPLTGFPNGYAPTFTNLTLASIRDDVTNPLTAFDTVVFLEVCDIGTYLANAQFKSRVEGFANSGGKLMFWDSECDATDYSNFVYPFTTSNPGAAGATGTLTIVENSDLLSANSADASFVDASLIASDTDAVGDGNIFTTQNAAWCVSASGTNTLGVNGPIFNYAKIGTGLIIYSGLDIDAMGTSFDPTSTSGSDHLARTWLNSLLVSPTGNLPCGVVAFGLILDPPTATNVVGTSQTMTATVFQNGAPAPGISVTITVTAGPHVGQTVTAVSDANGVVTFTYPGTLAGVDTVTASATIGQTPVSDTSEITWTEPPTTTTTTTVTQPVARPVAASPSFTG